MTLTNINIRVLGQLGKNAQHKFRKVLTIDSSIKNEIALFIDFSNFDVPIGHSFSKIVDSNGSHLYQGVITLDKVSQQFILPYDGIPHGHKTVCRFQFLESGIPEALNKLSEIDDWFDSNGYLVFS